MADNSLLLGGRMPSQQRRPDIPTLLRGLGAAATGQVPQFRQQMQAEETERMRNVMGGLQLEDALTKSAAQDALRIQQLAQTGDLRQAMDILGDRVQLEQQLGVDPSSTMRLADDLMSGGFDAILPQINSTVDMSVRMGIIEPFGGQVPSTFRSLQLQAEAAGLVPGTPQYEEFMKFGGGDATLGGRGLQRFANGTAIQYMPDGGVRVIHPVKGLITDPVEKQTEIDLAFDSGSIEAGATAAAQARAKGEEERAQTIITEGLAAADSTGVLRRAIELLDLVDTGGFAKYGLAARRIFGIEGADEGELSSNLGKAVLSQLRSTFGAAFTAREGESLKEIEAGFGFNTETNKRLLNNALAIANRAAQRAIRRAETREDFETSSEIEAALDFDISNFLQEIESQAEGGNGTQIPIVSTQAQYDQLNVGDQYRELDETTGEYNIYRKR